VPADATRPGWRRLAGRAKRAAFRVVTPIDRLVRWRDRARLPPAHLRIYYYGTWNPAAYARACANSRAELRDRGLRPDQRILDIGSGIGNLAIALLDEHHGGYDGVEIHPEAVAWCQRAITSRHPAFRFHRADLASRAYNPLGRTSASAYRFPFADGCFDVIFLASVFTHMLPDEVEQYLREIGRLLAPGGQCVESFFLLNDDTRPDVEAGRSFMTFPVRHASGVCRLHEAAVPESAVAFEEGFVRDLHAKAGLRIERVRRGHWWNGRAHDQDVLTAVRA
jgi:SAM-dependent methyltransferase